MMNALAEKPSLLTRYDNLRRKQREVLTATLDTLGKVDGLPEEQLAQARDALFHTDHPYLCVLVGAFNTGKSSLINALIGAPVLSVGATPTTNRIAILRYGEALQTLSGGDYDTLFYPSPLLQRLSFVDTPGLDSVFRSHAEVTRAFLHRADLVLLVMLATQAMSASSLSDIQKLRAYGKRLIVVVNQIDLIEPSEREAVRAFVIEQGKLTLGESPQVWLTSAKWASEATRSLPRDEDKWQASGFAQLEAYFEQALSDAERVRQKLETPQHIMRNVMSAANAQVAAQQSALAEYRRSAANVRGQIEASIREQEETARAIAAEIDAKFNEAIQRGQAAIRDVFRWSKAFSLAFSGLGEVVGIARFFRRFGAQTHAQNAFAQHKVDEPLAQIPAIADRLAPRLEGRDIRDVEDLVLHTKQELERLPSALQAKVIGTLSAPQSYDRTILKNVREKLQMQLDLARATEFKTIDNAVRNTIVALSVYVLAVLLIGGFLIAVAAATSAELGVWLLALLMVLALIIGGASAMPLRGAFMANAYARRMDAARRAYQDTLSKAVAEQIAYGRQLRQDAVAPFLRMVETQVAQADAIKAELAEREKALTALEAELSALR
ncbi:MAG: dynamin family protein [Anaerolineae bacterium]|nr:dynamin family protein [Anaerolineae bacterium]MDW8300255.1 dynamin family protein [Anaerolineae bacterium]